MASYSVCSEKIVKKKYEAKIQLVISTRYQVGNTGCIGSSKSYRSPMSHTSTFSYQSLFLIRIRMPPETRQISVYCTITMWLSAMKALLL